MIYVLARSAADVETWRRRVELPKSHVTYLGSGNATCGRQLARHEVIALEGASQNPKIVEIIIALAPCGVAIDNLPFLRIRP